MTELEQTEDCPAIGVGGMHSDEWFDGERCQWCGALPEPTPAEKLAQALESMRTGFRLKRENLRRANPDADEAELDRLLAEWLAQES